MRLDIRMAATGDDSEAIAIKCVRSEMRRQLKAAGFSFVRRRWRAWRMNVRTSYNPQLKPAPGWIGIGTVRWDGKNG